METRLTTARFVGSGLCRAIEVVLAIILLNGIGTAQKSDTLSGLVVDGAAAAIENASLELRIGDYVTATHSDSDGRFAFSIPLKIRSTAGVLVVSAPGFATKRIELSPSDPMNTIEVRLQPAPIIERIQIEADELGNSINSEMTVPRAEIA